MYFLNNKSNSPQYIHNCGIELLRVIGKAKKDIYGISIPKRMERNSGTLNPQYSKVCSKSVICKEPC